MSSTFWYSYKTNFKNPLCNVILDLVGIVWDFFICDSEFGVQAYVDLEEVLRDKPSNYRIEKLTLQREGIVMRFVSVFLDQVSNHLV